jgi:hypothetical protein
MIRYALLATAALVLTDARAQTYDISNLTVTNVFGTTDVFNGSFLYSKGHISDVNLSAQGGAEFMNTGVVEGRKGALFSLSDGSPPGIDAWTLALRTSAPFGASSMPIKSATFNQGDLEGFSIYNCTKKCGRITDPPASVHAAPELRGSVAVAALTLLLGGVAVLKGRPRA